MQKTKENRNKELVPYIISKFKKYGFNLFLSLKLKYKGVVHKRIV